MTRKDACGEGRGGLGFPPHPFRDRGKMGSPSFSISQISNRSQMLTLGGFLPGESSALGLLAAGPLMLGGKGVRVLGFVLGLAGKVVSWDSMRVLGDMGVVKRCCYVRFVFGKVGGEE